MPAGAGHQSPITVMRHIHTTYFDFQLPSEVLVKKVPNSRGYLRTVKTYTFILVYRYNLVILKVYFVHIVIN